MWDLATGRALKSIDEVAYGTGGLRIDPSGKLIYSHADEIGGDNDEGGIEVRDIETGKLVRKLPVGSGRGYVFSISHDGTRLIHGTRSGEITVWDAISGRPLYKFGQEIANASYVTVTPDGNSFALGLSNGAQQLWDLKTGQLVRPLEESDATTEVKGAVAAITSDARYLITGGTSVRPGLWDLENGHFVRKMDDVAGTTEETSADGYIAALATTQDGTFAFSASKKSVLDNEDYSISQWELGAGKRVGTFKHAGRVNALAVSGDGRRLVSGSEDKKLRLWNTADGALLRTFDGFECVKGCAIAIAGDTVRALDGGRRALSWKLDALAPIREFAVGDMGVSSVAITSDGRWAARVGYFSEWRLELWDLEKGRLVRTFAGLPKSHRFGVGNVAISPDGRRIVVAGTPTGVGIWDAQSGAQLATSFGGNGGSWLTIMPAGFFAGSKNSSQWLSVVRGLEAFDINQMYQSLYSPDLVRESLAGDPDGEVKKASEELNLEKVLDSGKAPEVVITSPKADTALKDEVITAEAHVTDQGGGIGRIEWQVNGVTAGVANTAPGSGKERTVSQTLALEPGDNVIEVVAYNGRNLLASLPVSTKVRWEAPPEQPKPKLHVIAVGINDYNDATFPKLSHAVDDAKAFGAAMQAAGEGLYGKNNVEVTYALSSNGDATAERLDHIISEVGAKTHPRDTFIFLAAAHGKSENGRFHLIPQDYRSDTPGTLADKTIGQDKLQDWFANRSRPAVASSCSTPARAGPW